MSGPDSVHVFTARMPMREYEALKAYSFYARRSINDIVLEALRTWLREHATAEHLEQLLAEARDRVRATVEELGEEPPPSADG